MLCIRPIPAFDDNYIWLLIDEARQEGFLVDPGDAEPVLAVLEAENITLKGILITHHHYDHVGGLARLCEAHQPVVYGPQNPAIEGIHHRVSESDSVNVLGLSFSVIEVPGHTLDHIAYYHEGAQAQPLLFCGDTLFAGGCGRLFEGTPAMMHASLQSLAALPADTQVYCAHEYTLANLRFAQAVEPDNGELQSRVASAQATRAQNLPTVPSEIGLERATNPFLRCEQPGLIASMAKQGRLTGEAPVEVFTAVRTWKDHF